MPLGDDSAGAQLSGVNVPTLPPRRKLKRIRAKDFQPSGRRFSVNSSGQYEGSHPVDQFVRMALSIIGGSIPSVPSMGDSALAIEVITADHVQKVTKLIRQKLASRVASGDLRVKSIEVEVRNGVTLRGVRYQNLALGREGTVWLPRAP